MNIQINCKDTVKENDLRYIFHNLQKLKNEYEINKNNLNFIKYINGKQMYYKKIKGNSFITTNIDVKCTGKTMYFKVSEKGNKK